MENLTWLVIAILLIIVFILCRKITAQKKQIVALKKKSEMSGTIHRSY